MLAHSSSVSTSPKFIITCLSSVLEMNPLPANPELFTKCTLPHQLFERSSKPTVDIKDTESLSDVHFCCKGINLCRITDHVTKHTPRLSALSSYHLFFKTSLGRIVIVLSVPTLLAIRSRNAGNLKAKENILHDILLKVKFQFCRIYKLIKLNAKCRVRVCNINITFQAPNIIAIV